MVRAEQAGRRPDFGLDAPPIVYGFAALAVVGAALLVVGGLLASPLLTRGGGGALVLGLVSASLMVYSSRAGKIRVRDRLLDGLNLRGDEDVLDLGYGSGLMLLGAAQRIPYGTGTGVDVRRLRDQAGSNRSQCLGNAGLLAVQDPEAFLWSSGTRSRGLIDWSSCFYGPLLHEPGECRHVCRRPAGCGRPAGRLPRPRARQRRRDRLGSQRRCSGSDGRCRPTTSRVAS